MQSCVPSCNDGTFANNGVCEVCDFRCATCIGSATNCISCPDGQLLYKGGCWATCPAILLSVTGTSGAACVDECPSGFWKVSNSECAPCSPQCTTCEGGPNNCTSCLHGSVSAKGTCTTQCGENEFSFSGVCVSCSDSCYGCERTPQNCIECARGYVRTGSICQKGCLNTQYYDNTERKCKTCSANCKTCSSFSYCTSCPSAGIVPRGGVCSECPYPCATCDVTKQCTTCLSGFYHFQGKCTKTCPNGAVPRDGACRCLSGIISNGACVASCNSGFTSINGNCQPCNSNCAECSGNINHCTRCISGFRLDSASKRCIPATQCAYGQALNANGVCQRICEEGFFYYESLCVFGGCFNGYADNGNGGCVRSSSNPTTSVACTNGQYLKDGVCVGNCGSGYYPDSLSGRCQRCSANCQACFTANFCIQCASGYDSLNGECRPTTSCGSGQFQYDDECVSSCPIGTSTVGAQCLRSCPPNTYYQSQICFINCPNGLRTRDACVNSCPSGTSESNGVCL